MKISLIAAISENYAIGKDNSLPWKLSADMRLFKTITTGHPIVMGRKTFESFGSKPLPGRTNIVISRNLDFEAADCLTCSSYAKAIQLASQYDEEEVFVIGGGEIYKIAMYTADKLYITHVNVTIDGDTFFPEINPEIWTLVEKNHHERDNKNQYDFDFCIYERILPLTPTVG